MLNEEDEKVFKIKMITKNYMDETYIIPLRKWGNLVKKKITKTNMMEITCVK